MYNMCTVCYMQCKSCSSVISASHVYWTTFYAVEQLITTVGIFYYIIYSIIWRCFVTRAYLLEFETASLVLTCVGDCSPGIKRKRLLLWPSKSRRCSSTKCDNIVTGHMWFTKRLGFYCIVNICLGRLLQQPHCILV